MICPICEKKTKINEAWECYYCEILVCADCVEFKQVEFKQGEDVYAVCERCKQERRKK